VSQYDVVGEGAAVLGIVAREVETLPVGGGGGLLLLNLGFEHVSRVKELVLQGDGLTRERLHKDLDLSLCLRIRAAVVQEDRVACVATSPRMLRFVRGFLLSKIAWSTRTIATN